MSQVEKTSKSTVHHTNSDPNSMFQRTQSISDKKRSPLPPPRSKIKHQHTMSTGSSNSTYLPLSVTPGGVAVTASHHASDSEASIAESNLSLSEESGTAEQPIELIPLKESHGIGRRKGVNRRRGSEWEIIEGLRDGQRFDSKPDRYAGYLHKKRKWPLKGWHKRYFVLEKGLLIYAKNPNDITRGRLHGSLDIGLSVISTKEKRKRLDIDAEEFIYHLKAKTIETFTVWVERLKAHRLYRQHVLTYGSKEMSSLRAPMALLEDIDSPVATTRPKIPALTSPEILTRDASLNRNLKLTGPVGRLTSWVVESGPTLDSINKQLEQTQETIVQLERIMGSMELSASSIGGGGDAETSGSKLDNFALSKIRWKHQIHRRLQSMPSLLQICKSHQNLIENKTNSRSLLSLTATSATPNSTATLRGQPDGLSPNVKKDRKKFGLRKKKSTKGTSGSVDLTQNFSNNIESNPISFTASGSSPQPVSNTLSASNNSLSGALNNNNLPVLQSVPRPHSLPSSDYERPGSASMDINQTNLDHLTRYSRHIHGNLKAILYALMTERNRFKAAIDSASIERSDSMTGSMAVTSATTQQNSSINSMVHSLRSALNQAMQQNHELRTRLAKVHENSDLSDLSSMEPASEVCRQFNASLSYSSSCVSGSEFYDAEDHVLSSPHEPRIPKRRNLNRDEDDDDEDDAVEPVIVPNDATDTSSEEAGSITSEDGASVSSENSEIGTGHSLGNEQMGGIVDCASPPLCLTGRRTKLPVPRPDTEGLSLWNLLMKNIGKDLSQISMPVALNEPLNMLQKLCEELEYSELIDFAAELEDPYERMVYIAAFAVSSYGSSCHRAGNKPFNPLLGETYECIREDKGFRFISEQVSHHPPVSVCYADSRNFTFWQNARIKTKFWGKSMEFQPLGQVHLKLTKTNDHYKWNKVTTCVHNLFSSGGQRWVDQYGELKITNVTKNIECKLTFVKASYWSAKKHEIYGQITTPEGKVARKLFGKWSEALYCGVAPSSAKLIWRPGTMPEDYQLYYGFTRFAIELNEIKPEDVAVLPVTDTRYRPDQRALENGQLELAEKLKLQLEQGQRDRRKKMEMEGDETSRSLYQPRWFDIEQNTGDDGEDNWETNHKYWEVRKNPGFASLNIESLW